MKKEENLGLLVTLKAKKGKEQNVKDFLLGGLEIVNNEAETVSWFAYQIDAQTFGIYDTFTNDEGRNSHLNGDVAKALMANANELLEEFDASKSIQKAEILALDLKKGNQDIGLLVNLKAKEGKDEEVEAFLKLGQTIVHAKEPKTVSWYALKLGNGNYAIFDTSHDEEGRLAHLNGEVAAALMEKAPEIIEGFSIDAIKKIDVIASK